MLLGATQAAWRTQYFQIAYAPAPMNWKLVKGPAGAFSRSVLGVLDLRVTAPSVARWPAQLDYEAVGWEQRAQRPDVMPEIPGPLHKDPAGIWLAPIRGSLQAGAKAKRWVLDLLARAALRTAVLGGHFSQQRLYQYAYATSPHCLRCWGTLGTLHHRYWCCPTLDDMRERAVGE
eukprot:5912495-Pyramimonas_sp.AAC.1